MSETDVSGNSEGFAFNFDANGVQRWTLEGYSSTVKAVMRLVADELRYAEGVGFLYGEHDTTAGLGIDINLTGPQGSPRLGRLYVLDLPHNRSQLRLRLNDIVVGQEKAMAMYVAAALHELYRSGFVVGDAGTGARLLPEGSEEPYSADEQASILERLTTLEESILTQHELSRELAAYVRQEFALLREQLPRQPRRVWQHLARSVLSGIAGAVGGEAGKQIAWLAVDLLRGFMSHVPLLGSGGGGSW